MTDKDKIKTTNMNEKDCDEIIERETNSIIASMGYEGLNLTDKEERTVKKILKGEISVDESCEKVVKKYNENLIEVDTEIE